MSKIHMREKLIEKSVTPSGAPTSLKLGPNNWYIYHHKFKFSWHSKQNHLYFKLLKKTTQYFPTYIQNHNAGAVLCTATQWEE